MGSRDDEQPGPADPFTQMTEGAAQFHEQFMSYVEAGFSRPEAMQIMCAMLTAVIMNGPPPA